ncbi:hypothetical protein [Polymorphospora rubra]|uniref:hypothetical protein n=1 Tax=Polymorphospora rubra TaxID=338584 RepID=UPI0033DE8D42
MNNSRQAPDAAGSLRSTIYCLECVMPADVVGGPRWRAAVAASATATTGDDWVMTLAYGDRVMGWAKRLLKDPAVLALVPQEHRDVWLAAVPGHLEEAYRAADVIGGGGREESTRGLLAATMEKLAQVYFAIANVHGGGTCATDVVGCLTRVLPESELAGFWERAQPVEFLEFLILPWGAVSDFEIVPGPGWDS